MKIFKATLNKSFSFPANPHGSVDVSENRALIQRSPNKIFSSAASSHAKPFKGLRATLNKLFSLPAKPRATLASPKNRAFIQPGLKHTTDGPIISPIALQQLQRFMRSNGHPAPSLEKPVGNWSITREHLPYELIDNLKKLVSFPKGESRLAFQQEINEHWKCMSNAEKVKVLEIAGRASLHGEISAPLTVAQLIDLHEIKQLAKLPSSRRKKALEEMPPAKKARLDACRLRGPAITWLHSTLSAMNSNGTLQDFLPHLSKDAVDGLNEVLLNKPNRNMLDVDFDYKHFLKFNVNPIMLPPEAHGKEIAIVGSGAAAAVAARMLLQAGAKPVIFEQDSKTGGRLHTRRYREADGSEAREFSEIGGMRFPSNGRTWFYFLKQFGVKTIPDFPNPGKVPTALHFKNEVINWPAGAPTPDNPMFQKIAADFKKFVNGLMAPMEEARKAHDTKKMQEIFQAYLNKYGNKNFRDALVEGLQENGIHWTKDEFDAFGTLGLGTGGFSAFYPVCFMEMLRLVLNQFESDQHLLPEGAAMALNKFYSTEVPLPDGGSASLEANINLRTQVTDIKANNGKPIVEFKGPDDTMRTKEYAAVIVATTPGAMQKMGLSQQKTDSEQVLSANVANAINDLHMMSSSKLFIRTPTKFWLDENGNPRIEKKPDGSFGPIPQNIQTDQLANGVYCLDYPDTDHGVVLMSYSWGEKSDKLMGMSHQERMDEFRKTIAQISPEFAANLIPVNGEIHAIDWQSEPAHHGAFKLNKPGKEASQQEVFYQYQDASSGVVLAGDSVSHMGGWVEGAMQTGIHAACAIAMHLGGSVTEGSPLELDKNRFKYGRPVSPDKVSKA